MTITINGDGSISGLSVGGLGSNVVNSTSLHNDAVTTSHMPHWIYNSNCSTQFYNR